MASIMAFSTIKFTDDEKKQLFEEVDVVIRKAYSSKNMLLIEVPEGNYDKDAANFVTFLIYTPPAKKEQQRREIIQDLEKVLLNVVGHRIPEAHSVVLFKNHRGDDAGWKGTMHIDNGIY